MGDPPSEVKMKSPMVIVLVVVVLVTFSTLAIMNNACKNNPTDGALQYELPGPSKNLGAANAISLRATS